MVYLDHASAEPWHPAARTTHAAVAEQFFADPTRRHQDGRRARDLLESARAAVAGMFGASQEALVFTSGGTEAIHLAVVGTALANRTRPRRILSSAVEHSAVLAAAAAAGDHEHVEIGVDADGRVDLDILAEQLQGGAALVNVQHANHEVGTVQPLAEVGRLCRAHDALLHVDACQTAGRMPLDLTAVDADYVSLSAAKFGGGRGTGALAMSPRARLRPLLGGDERERRRRSGLENLPGAVAMAETLLQLSPNDPRGPAAEQRDASDTLRRHLRRRLPELVDDLAVHGPDDDSAAHIVSVSALYCDGETLVGELDRRGYAVHSGSSCATTSGEPSHVLVAMNALTHGHIRISVGPGVTVNDVEGFAQDFAAIVAALRSGSTGPP